MLAPGMTKYLDFQRRGLTEQIPNWLHFPQLGILNFKLGIFDPCGDWGFMSQVSQSQRINRQSPNW